jgi:hypothetical protein
MRLAFYAGAFALGNLLSKITIEQDKENCERIMLNLKTELLLYLSTCRIEQSKPS